MNYRLSHIFDKSACLTLSQMKRYVDNEMISEENHATEHHLNNCSLCSESIEGMQEFPGEATAVLSKLNTRFLNDHMSLTHPNVHLNSFAPPTNQQKNKKAKKGFIPVAVTFFAGLLLVVTIFMGVKIKYSKKQGDAVNTGLEQKKEFPQSNGNTKVLINTAKDSKKLATASSAKKSNGMIR